MTWAVPKFEDNSQTIDVNHRVKLTEDNNYKPPHIFGIGTHIIRYTVTDKEGLSSFCQFSIKVEGIYNFLLHFSSKSACNV